MMVALLLLLYENEFSLKVKVMGSNLGYILIFSLLYVIFRLRAAACSLIRPKIFLSSSFFMAKLTKYTVAK